MSESISFHITSNFVQGKKQSLSDLHEFLTQCEREAELLLGKEELENGIIKYPTAIAVHDGIPMIQWIPIQ